MNLEDFVRMKALNAAFVHANHSALDIPQVAAAFADAGDLKRIQFETMPIVSEILDETCSLLGTTRRQFLEFAVIFACNHANSLFLAEYKSANGGVGYFEAEPEEPELATEEENKPC